MKKTIFAGITCLTLTGCASSPGSIQATYVPNSPYMSMNCLQLGETENIEGDKLAALDTSQNNAHKTDFWGVFATGVPLSELTGSDVSEALARQKGKMAAIHRVQIAKGCPM